MNEFMEYRVLVVEDEPKILRNVIHKVELSKMHFTVVGSARNGDEALGLLRELNPDLLMTDIKMPRMDGLELIQHAREEFPHLAVIILSGYDEFEYAKRAIQLGVTDYLVKLVDEESLGKALTSVRKRLDSIRASAERDIVLGGLQGQNIQPPQLPKLNGKGYQLCLICLGNLCGHASSKDLFHRYKALWDTISMKQILSDLWSPQRIPPWWLIDEASPNQKLLVLTAPAGKSMEQITQHIFSTLSDRVPGHCIHLCCTDTPVGYQEVWHEAQELRKCLEDTAAMDISSVVCTQHPPAVPELPDLLDTAVLGRVVFAFQSGNTRVLQKTLSALFKQWETYPYPQKNLESSMRQLLNHFRMHAPVAYQRQFKELTALLGGLFSAAESKSVLFAEITQRITDILASQQDTSEAALLCEEISKYIQRHFAEELSLERVAQKFCISTSYTSKLIKRYQNKSFLQYLITLRIQEAKRLLEQYPETDIKDIGVMVGYQDQHYFSRIFKQETGVSPSEYRGKLL